MNETEQTTSEDQPEPMTEAEYVANGGRVCPFCGSEDFEGSSIEIDESHAYQEISCLECDETWVDVYKLSGYYPGRL